MLASFRASCFSTRRFSHPSSRPFSSTHVACAAARKTSARRIPSKKAQATKNKRRENEWLKEQNSGEKLPLATAIHVLRAVEVMRPFASYELSVRLRLSGNTPPRGRFDLPNKVEIKSDDKILVFAEGQQAIEAKQAGAHIVGGTELIDQLLNNSIRPTMVLCVPSLLKPITPRLGRHLGPMGLMPSERRGTVVEDVAGYLRKIVGMAEWKSNKEGKVTVPIGRMSFTAEQVTQNVRAFLDALQITTGNKRAPAVSGVRTKAIDAQRIIPVGKIMLSSTQGPAIRLSDALL